MNYFSKMPRYLQIAQMVEHKVLCNAYHVRIPSESDLMKEYNASRLTIRNAIKVLTQDKLIIAKHGKGYFIHPEGKVKAMKNTVRQLLAVKTDVLNGYNIKKISGLEIACREGEISLNTYYLAVEYNSVRKLAEIISAANTGPHIRGVILLDYYLPKEVEVLKNALPVPLLTIGYQSAPDISSMEYDNYRIGELTVEYLAEKHPECIYLFASEMDIAPVRERIRGFRETAARKKLPCQVIQCGPEAEDIRKALKKNLPAMPNSSGLAFFRDDHADVAEHFLQHTNSAKWCNFHLIGFGKSLKFPHPRFASIDSNVQEEVRLACNRFIDQVSHGGGKAFHEVSRSFNIVSPEDHTDTTHAPVQIYQDEYMATVQ